MGKTLLLLFILLGVIPVGISHLASGQTYDLLLKGGHLLDAKNGIDDKMDIAIKEGRIAKIAENIPIDAANKVLEVNGLIVSPGLIDPHTHVYVGENHRVFAGGTSSVWPDAFSFRSGVTTVVDAGTSGWRNFEHFKHTVIDRSQTRVLAFLNIVGGGMQGKPLEENIEDMIPDSAFAVGKQYQEYVVGIKIGHYEGEDWAPFDRALEAADLLKSPLLVECHLPNYTLSEQLERMRPGDILSHTYENIKDREPIISKEGSLLEEVQLARQKGVLFDVSHGGAGFWFNQAIPAIEQGLKPDTFGTDLHLFSMNASMKNMSNVLSKFIALGMTLPEVISRATWGTAEAIGREDLGHLSVGAVADIAVFCLKEGTYGFVDAGGEKIIGNKRLEAEMTLREGRIVYDLNGISASPYYK